MNRSYNLAMDQKLNISTELVRDHGPHLTDMYRTESTDYLVLEQILDQLPWPSKTHFLDVGCGTGRALFYFHYHIKCKVTGIEAHPLSFRDLQNNKSSYLFGAHKKDTDIELYKGLAQDYSFQGTENVLYLFNPFSPYLLSQFLDSLTQSLLDQEREIIVAYYYPRAEVFQSFEDYDFYCIQEIDIDRQRNEREIVAVFRQ